jgi:hypothetical protein
MAKKIFSLVGFPQVNPSTRMSRRLISDHGKTALEELVLLFGEAAQNHQQKQKQQRKLCFILRFWIHCPKKLF